MAPSPSADPVEGPPSWLIAFMALACGLCVANLYYAQPLAGPIARALGMSPAATGLVVTLSQLGYGAGLILIAPLGDLIENRRLIVTATVGGALALGLAGAAPSALPFLAASFLVGVGAVSAQMLVPVAAHLAPPAARGRVVGDVMSGLLAGILLSRPVGSLLADHLGWRWVFLIAALATLVLAAALRRLLPERRPQSALSYGQLLGSMGALLRGTPILRRRAAYQSCMFAAFSLFWTTAPLLLASRVYRLSQTEIAFFALAGATGALVAPVAGRMADRGWTRPATGAAFIAAGLSFLLCWFGRQGALWALVCAGLILDLGVQTSQVLGQRAIYSLGAAERSRLNGLYVSLFFIGGALGSAGGGLAYALGGWAADCGLGAGICLLALALYLTEFRATPRPMAQAH